MLHKVKRNKSEMPQHLAQHSLPLTAMGLFNGPPDPFSFQFCFFLVSVLPAENGIGFLLRTCVWVGVAKNVAQVSETH